MLGGGEFVRPEFVRRVSVVRRARKHGGAEGYALADALVALLVLSVSLVLSLRALAQARETTELAWELRRAEARLSHLLDAVPRRLAASAGEGGGFGWSLEMQPVGAEQPISLCRRAATITSAESGRTFTAATRETCPLGAGA